MKCRAYFVWASNECPNPAETTHDGVPCCHECADELRQLEHEHGFDQVEADALWRADAYEGHA